MIERSFDYDLINGILRDPIIFATIAEDCNVDRETYKTAESEDIYYLVAYVKSEPIGVFIVHPDSACSYQLHVNMLKQYRAKYSRIASEKALEWISENIGRTKINVAIPDIYRNVIKCAEDCGFIFEGLKTRSYLKDGIIRDVILMGRCL